MKRVVILVIAVLIAFVPMGQVRCETMSDRGFLDELIDWGKTVLIFLSRIDSGIHTGQTDKEHGEEQIRKLVTALQRHDTAVVKSMFAEKAILEADDFDGMVKKAMNCFNGDIKEIIVNDPNKTESYEGSRKRQILELTGRIITDKDTYRLYAEYRRQNYTDEDADLIGFSFIYLIDEEKMTDPGRQYSIPPWWQAPGIHLDESDPDQQFIYTCTETFCNACLHGETAAVESMFAPAAQDECAALCESIQEASGFFDGEFLMLQDVAYSYYFEKDDPGANDTTHKSIPSIQWTARITTTASSYFVIVNYSRRSDGDAEQTGIWSVLLSNNELPHEKPYYSKPTADENVGPGLHIIYGGCK